MPNPISYTKSEGRKYVPPTSRYANSLVIIYEDKIAYPIYRKKNIKPNLKDQHYEITKEMEFRPDKLSVKFYGAPDFWWRIMEINRMKDILEFRAGRNIIMPGSSLLM